MGVDRRGLWIDDPDTGTKFRLGEVSVNLAMAMAEHGNVRAAREAMGRVHLGAFLERRF